MTEQRSYYHSPIGYFELVATDDGLTGCYFMDETPTVTPTSHPILQLAVTQLDAYFNKTLQQFTIPLDLKGTAFRQQVWQVLQMIPFGKTISYIDIATQVGNPKASRAIGQANHYNPVPIIVPCHRVINRSGKLGGYGGGLWRKEWLLAHEQTAL